MTTIRVSCPEGHRLVIKEEHAGRKIRCPKCQAIMEAPANQATAGAQVSVAKKVRRPAFVCPAGHRFLVRTEQLGQTVSCPLCEQTVHLSGSPDPTATGVLPQAAVGIANPAVAGSNQSVIDPNATPTASAPPEQVWPLMVLVGSAAAALIGIAAWLSQQTEL